MVGIKHATTSGKVSTTVWGEAHTIEGVARAYLTNDQTIGDSSATKVTLDAESFDPDGVFDVSNNRYAPAAIGYYLCMGSAEWIDLADGDICLVSLYKNGSEVSSVHQQTGKATDQLNTFIADIIYLSATTDYVELYVYHEKGSNADIDGGTDKTWMSVTPLRI